MFDFGTKKRTRDQCSLVKGQTMVKILKSGLIESNAQVMELAERYGQIVIPNEDEDLDLTHWWIMSDDGTEMMYVGTVETFATYIKERDGGCNLPN